jgi:hypothetical protein
MAYIDYWLAPEDLEGAKIVPKVSAILLLITMVMSLISLLSRSYMKMCTLLNYSSLESQNGEHAGRLSLWTTLFNRDYPADITSSLKSQTSFAH